MKKIVCLFPGQGSQYVGMGSHFLNDDCSSQIFSQAESVLGFSLKKIMLEGPEEKLKQTEFTQPAILTQSWIIFCKLKEFLDKKNLSVDYVLGHSVGEYSALLAAKTFNFEDAVKAVHYRGKFMQQAVPEGKGAMIAILKVPLEEIKNACTEVSTASEAVMPANINSSGQIVVSGNKKACDNLIDWFKNNYKAPYRAIPLKVSAPFHSTLMKPAELKLQEFLPSLEIKKNNTAYIDNLTATINMPNTPAAEIHEKLIGQVCGAVRWEDSLKMLPPEDYLFLEVGPGKTLSGIARNINRSYKVVPLDVENFEQTLGEHL